MPPSTDFKTFSLLPSHNYPAAHRPAPEILSNKLKSPSKPSFSLCFLFSLQIQSRFMTMNMIMSFSSIFFFFSVLNFLFQPSHSSIILVDGTSDWKNPTVHVGDSIVFKHKQHYNLYIFQNQRAFNLCNFSQATLLTNPNTTSFTWHPSRTGFFYFAFNDGSLRACQASQKLGIKVSNSASPPQASTMSPEISPAPAPSSGGEVSSPPTFPWPFHPREAASPGPSTDKGGGMPFINSNPAVPLPTGEVDSATIRPLPTSGTQRQVMIGIFGFQIALHSIALLLPLLL